LGGRGKKPREHCARQSLVAATHRTSARKGQLEAGKRTVKHQGSKGFGEVFIDLDYCKEGVETRPEKKGSMLRKTRLSLKEGSHNDFNALGEDRKWKTGQSKERRGGGSKRGRLQVLTRK